MVYARMRLSDNFKLSYGVRVDVPVWEDGLTNADFNKELQAGVRKAQSRESIILQLILHHV
jgi:hypothetical protein